MTTVSALKDVPLLSCLNQRELKRLAKSVREQTFAPETTVVRENKMSGVGFYIITAGEAAVTMRGKEVARLHAGDHFGELGLIGQRERGATVTAITPLTCQVMATWDLEELVMSNPGTAWKLIRQLIDMLAAAQATQATSR
jgi:CRP-like cAMP-binding protein